MKRLLYCLCTICLLASCHTPLYVTSIKRVSSVVETPKMEFIGLKNMNRNNAMLRDFGAELERNNIALNRQSFYPGNFSLTELENYSSTMRYVTFLDVVKQSYARNDAINDNYDMWLSGVTIASFSLGTLFPVYVPLLCCWDKNDCQIVLTGEYNLVVYDTQEHKIIISMPVEINVKDDYKGQYSHKKTDANAVDTHYKNLLFNALMEHYLQIYNNLL